MLKKNKFNSKEYPKVYNLNKTSYKPFVNYRKNFNFKKDFRSYINTEKEVKVEFLHRVFKKILKPKKKIKYSSNLNVKIKKKVSINTLVYLKLLNKALHEINNFNFLKVKVLNSLHLYTGYSIVNIFAKPLNLFQKKINETKYTNRIAYMNFYFSEILLKKNINPFVTKKLIKKKKVKLSSRLKSKINNFFYKDVDIHENIFNFLSQFPFYLLKIFKKFITKLLKFFSIENLKVEYKYKLLQSSFKFVYRYYKGHFFKAFKFYKLLLEKLFYSDYLNVKGIKVIFKGRFGKVRKQIKKLALGSLNLTSIRKKTNYFSSLLVTNRGSYGFHMWFSQKNESNLNSSAFKMIKLK